LEQKRICKGLCKKYTATKPVGSRYGSGQGRCQVCDVWISHKGARMKDGSPATKGSVGWFCLCCNFRIRQKPRNKIYKEKFHDSQNHANIPKYQQLMLPILRACSQKHHTRKELEDYLADRFNLTEQERHLILRKKETYLTNRTYWAMLFLRKGNLLAKEEGGFFYATEDGEKVLSQSPSEISKKFLLDIPAFHKWINKSYKKDESKKKADNSMDDLVRKSLGLIKPDGTYLSDLAMSRDISDDAKELLVNKISKIQGVKKEDILYDGKPLETMPRYDPTLEDVVNDDRLNGIIQKAMDLIKSTPHETYMSELKVLLGIPQNEVLSLSKRLGRLDTIQMKEIQDNERITDFSLTYVGSNNIKKTSNPNGMLPKKTHRYVSDSDDIDYLVRKVKEQNVNQKTLNKSLQKRLTVEFLNTGSVNAVVRSHPDIPKEEIKRHIRSPMRLPEELRIRNEVGLHPDPQLSLQIALFAVNYHDWDGDQESVETVIQTAEETARLIIESETRKTKPNPAHGKNSTNTEFVSTSIAVWIATATLHKEHGIDSVFSPKEIMEKISEQGLCQTTRNTISLNISINCVANTPHKPGGNRSLYRVSVGMYRLYRKGDTCHPTREGCKIVPVPFQIPQKYRYLRRWYDEEYRNQE